LEGRKALTLPGMELKSFGPLARVIITAALLFTF
jgi:hypothetical protein